MKICGYCNNTYDDKEPKCPVCGSTLLKHVDGIKSAAEERERLKAEVTQRRRMRSLILGVGAVAVVLVVVFILSSLFSFLNDPQRKVNKESSELLSQAEQQMDSGSYDDALNTLDQIDPSWEDYDRVNDVRLNVVKEQLKAQLAEYQASGDYAAIITLINENVGDINSDAEVKTAYEDAVENYRATVVASAEDCVAVGDYVTARSTLTVAMDLIGDDLELSEKLKEINQQEVLEAVLAYETEGNYAEAIRYLNQNSAVVSGSTELQTKLSTYTEQYRTNVLAEAKSAYEESGYEAAVAVLNTALGVLPNDATINNEKDKYETAVPVPLIDLDVIKQGDHFYVGADMSSYSSYSNSLFDHLEELYQDVNGDIYPVEDIHFVEYFFLYEGEGPEDRSITYYLNQEYDILTGVLFRPYLTLSFSEDWIGEGCVEIYGDGAMIYSAAISHDSYDIVEINANVTGIRELKIIFSGMWRDPDWNSNYFSPTVCLANLEVSKAP